MNRFDGIARNNGYCEHFARGIAVVTRFARQPLVVAVMLATLSGSAFAVRLARPHHARHRHVRSLGWNPMFPPSRESLLVQNAEVDRLKLPRIQDEAELEALKADGSLLEIRNGETLRVDPRLDPSRRYCRPWARDFVEDLSHAYYRRFHQQIQVNSAVRTVKVQRNLRRHNLNAAPVEGDTASSHLAGVTLDLQRLGMTKEQVRWLELYLFYMKALGLVEPEEERSQLVFHVMVSGRYSEWRSTQSIIPVDHPIITRLEAQP